MVFFSLSAAIYDIVFICGENRTIFMLAVTDPVPLISACGPGKLFSKVTIGREFNELINLWCKTI